MEGYCVKCKAKKEMQKAAVNKTAKGGFMIKGSCPDCNTTMCKITSQDNAKKAIAEGIATQNF